MTLSPQTMLEQNLKNSVIEHPTLNQGRLRLGVNKRGPLLPAWGSRERERILREYYHHDYNTLFRGAIAALIKRVQSTPWEVKAPEGDGDRWQQLLMTADFGDWDRFIAKIITDYSRHDQGTFIELIGPGSALEAPLGAVTGLAVLDSVRCYPTGAPNYPVLYYDLNGKIHALHRGRVVQFLDTPDSDESTPGYGDCALSRAIAPVRRQILIGRYIEQALDDEPPPGITVFGNLGRDQVDQAIETMHNERQRDTRGEWGRMLRLYGLRAEDKPTVDSFTFTKPPEKFDFEQYTNLDAREIALSIGIDIQDIWGELSGTGLGSKGQSEILAQKSRGKGFGRILKGLERLINRALPEDVEFKWKYEDPQEDMEQAQILQATASSVQVLGSTLSPEEARSLLANTSQAVRDVLVDETGKVRRRGDTDPKAEDQQIKPDINSDAPAPQQPADDTTLQNVTKDFNGTSEQFVQAFIGTINQVGDDAVSAAVARALLRDQLWQYGMMAYEDGLREGGVDPVDADAEELARRRRIVATWNASQTGYIDSFVDDILRVGLSPDEVRRRAGLWISKSLRSIYFAGLEDANGQQMYQWRLGMTEKHCRTCLTLNGQVHPMKKYVKAGLLPGSSALECNGYECDCKLVKVAGRERGRMPGDAPSLSDRLVSWLSGLVGRS